MCPKRHVKIPMLVNLNKMRTTLLVRKSKVSNHDVLRTEYVLGNPNGGPVGASAGWD
jgi:hypothetical protein